MNAETEKLRNSLVDQLESFEGRLGDKIDDVDMLGEIQEGIGRLLASAGGSEAEIRRVLQERYDSGALRKETFQLVKSMLDRYVSDIVETSPSIAEASAVLEGKLRVSAPPKPVPPAASNDDVLSSTVVLPTADSAAPEESDSRAQVGSVLRDRFLLQERVSGGSMGAVYKAMDRRLAEAGTDAPWVAIKVLAPELAKHGKALRALQQEAAKHRVLVHPHIVRFIDFDREDDLYFIVMEWLEGRTLGSILDSPDAKGIDTERAFEIVRQIGKALEYAHKCGIVHADVKPNNIMIMPNGDAKLFDFGIARVRQEQLEEDRKFDPGVLGVMTPAYSSMQVLTGETPIPADDVFSLACLLYRLIAGFRVFGPRNAAEAADEGMQPERLDVLNDAQWRVLHKALSYSRVARFATVTDFLEAFDVEESRSMTIDIPAPKRFAENRESGGFGKMLIGIVVLAAIAAVVANHLGYLDDFKARYVGTGVASEEVGAIIEGPAVEETLPAGPEEAAPEAAAPTPPAADTDDEEKPAVEDPAADQTGDPAATQSDPATEVESITIPELEELTPPLVDFSKLAPPTAVVGVGRGTEFSHAATVTLREDVRGATVDLVRDEVAFPSTLRVEEISFSGNRSPWSTGQYWFSDSGFVEFPVGQDRARLTLSMASDSLREADQQSTLRIREADSPGTELATITVLLEDDDQRTFETTLPANTVAFASSQVSVNEKDPAVQIDIIRFNPDDTKLLVGYTVHDITATQGEDYFAPGGYTITFGPGQRATRLLIPLVQDSTWEDNEAFSVELSGGESPAGNGVFRRIAVLIRDDDQ